VYAVSDGPYWIEFPRENTGPKCEYYPCHFEGQDCTHCYCPLYPCEDPGDGRVDQEQPGHPVWTCKDCTLLHDKKAVDYLAKHPTPDEGPEARRISAGFPKQLLNT